MKAITVQQPHADWLLGPKWVENRPRRWLYRGPILIHAGKGTSFMCSEDLDQRVTGAIIGVSVMQNCVHLATVQALAKGPRADELVDFCDVTWRQVAEHDHTRGEWLLIVRHPRRFREPIPYRGQLGLFEVPDHVVADAIAHAEAA